MWERRLQSSLHMGWERCERIFCDSFSHPGRRMDSHFRGMKDRSLIIDRPRRRVPKSFFNKSVIMKNIDKQNVGSCLNPTGTEFSSYCPEITFCYVKCFEPSSRFRLFGNQSYENFSVIAEMPTNYRPFRLHCVVSWKSFTECSVQPKSAVDFQLNNSFLGLFTQL